MLILVLLISLFTPLPGQEVKAQQQTKEPVTQESNNAASYCSQADVERKSLIQEAIEKQYTVGMITFSGNVNTRDRVLRRKILLEEGDAFTRENLIKSLENVSKLKKIFYPVKLDDVLIRVDRPNKIIDMMICFREKRK